MDFQKVWKEYGAQLRRFLRSRVSSADDAEDILQEILIKTHKKMASVKEPKKFKAWLFQIARNTLTDYYRKAHLTFSDQDISEWEAPMMEPMDQRSSALAELTRCIKPFLEQLPQKYRDVVEESDLNGVSQKVLAEELGLSYSALKSRVQRGRHMLRELFESCCSYELDSRGNILDFSKTRECC